MWDREIIEIENIKGLDIETERPLTLRVKQYVLWLVAAIIVVMILFALYSIHSHQYINAAFFIVLLIVYLIDSYRNYFPLNLPKFTINENGIYHKKTFFPWNEIEKITYEIRAKKTDAKAGYLNLYLLNKKKIVVYIGLPLVGSSIEEIATYINHYWKRQQ